MSSAKHYFEEQAAWDESHAQPAIEYLKIHRGDVEAALESVREDLYEPKAVRDWKSQYADEIAEQNASPADAHRWWAEEYLWLSEQRLAHRNPAKAKPRKAKRNPASPEVREAAVAKFREFHRLEPTKITDFPKGFKIPTEMQPVGRAKYTTYRSGKVDPDTLKKPRRPVDYIHSHDAGVTCYLPVGDPDLDELEIDADPVKVPRAFASVEALVKLGDSLGCAFQGRHDDEPWEIESVTPLPELYCTPDGKCLLVIQGRREVLCMVWGGALGVFSRGIDG